MEQSAQGMSPYQSGYPPKVNPDALEHTDKEVDARKVALPLVPPTAQAWGAVLVNILPAGRGS